MSDDEYKGMSDESAKAYEERQNEPLFKNASSMIPMEQVKQHYENLMCGFHDKDGCEVIKRDRSFYACIWHQAMQAIGTDFFWYYRLVNDNELSRMSAEQHKQLEQRRKYQTSWLDNYPRGATG
jgi:hypothetical protein